MKWRGLTPTKTATRARSIACIPTKFSPATVDHGTLASISFAPTRIILLPRIPHMIPAHFTPFRGKYAAYASRDYKFAAKSYFRSPHDSS